MAEAAAAAATPQPGPPVSGEAVLRDAGIQHTQKAVRQPPIEGMEAAAARDRARPAAERSSFRSRARQGRRLRDRDLSMRRFGDTLLARNLVNYDPDHEVSYVDSFDLSLSSSDKENVEPGRKRLLDDALFEFFRKEAVKSLKSNFSNFCNDSDIWSKNKRFKRHVIGRDCFLSYSLKYYWEILNSLSTRRKEIIRNFGFGCLLMFERSEIPSAFVRWLASCVDTVSSQIIVDDCKVIPISKDFLHHVIGLPNSGSVPMPDSERGAKAIMSIFGLTELPHITFFGNKLKSKEVLTDKEVFACFIVVAFKCFLFPTVDEYPNTDFLSILEDPTSANGVDICMLVYEHLISGVSNFNKICKLNGRKPKSFEFCYYALAVYYLDALDFGARMVDQIVPRISVWKGNLIKFFSDLDHKKNNLFGKRQLKKNLALCYRQFGVIGDYNIENDARINHVEYCFSPGFEEAMHIRFGSTLEAKIIDGIVESVKSAQLAKLHNVHQSELLVNNILNFLICLKPSDVKAQSAETNALGTCNSEHVKPESDLASKLDLVSPGVFSNSLAGNNLGTSFVSPGFVMPNAGEPNTFKTAPAMQPMHKVRSRLAQQILVDQALPSLNTHPAGVKDTRSFLYISSPISHFNLSPSSNVKDPKASCTAAVETVLNNTLPINSNLTGTKHAPIPISDASHKPHVANISPEVQITRTSSFSFRQAELAKKGDELYNSLANNCGNKGNNHCASKVDDAKNDSNFIDLSQHAVETRIARDDLVILQPKNSLVLPLVQNGRFSVSDLDIRNFCAIVDLAYTQGIQKTYAVKYPRVHCSYISLGQSLMVQGHVDNFLIPVFCRKLFDDNHPSKSGRHHFFSLVGESILDYEYDAQLSYVSKAFIGAASASKGKRLELSDRLFFPICRMRHWFTFCVDFKYKLFIFLDSLFNKDDDFHTSIKNRLINNFVKIWKKAFKTDDNIFKKFGVMYAIVPKQDNADDCGVFTMKLMEIFKPELDMRRFFGKEDIVNIRIQYANKLFFCSRNQAGKSLVTEYIPK